MNNIVPDGYLCPLCGLPFYGGCEHSAVDIMIDAAEKIDAQAAEIERLLAEITMLETANRAAANELISVGKEVAKLQKALDRIINISNEEPYIARRYDAMRDIARAAREKREADNG